MWQRFTWSDVGVIAHYLGLLVLVFSVSLLVPLATAVIFQEWKPAENYLLTIGICFSVGSLLRLVRVEPGRLSRQQAMVVTGISWIVLAFFAAIPLYLSGHFETFLDALFDGVSGITTTGASIISDLDHLSNADNMWRFMIHFMGGLGLIVVALSLNLFGKKTKTSLYSSEGRSEQIVPNVVQTTQFISGIALGFIFAATVLITFLCLFAGMEPSRAFLHALWMSVSGFITGGFTPMSQSIMYYQSFAIELVLMLLMLLGTVNFVLLSEAWRGRVMAFFKDIEIRTMVVWLVLMTAILAYSMSSSLAFSGLLDMLRRGLFIVISAFSTTGFLNITANQLALILPSGAFLVIIVLMAMGGGAGSTAGGIKFNRMGMIIKSLSSTIKEALSPDSARVVVSYQHIGRRVLTPEIAKEAMTIFVLYVITYVIGTLVGVAHGYEAILALFESVAMTSNGGLTAGIVSQGMPETLQIFYILQMWAGRLEFVTLLALIVKIVVSLDLRKKA